MPLIVMYWLFRRSNAGFIISTSIFLMLVGTFWKRYGAAEDALILFRYSHNLADGFGITYNAGSTPVEGATAFLWMVILSIGAHLNIDIMTIARIVSVLGGIVILYIISVHSKEVGQHMLSVIIPPMIVAITYLPQHTLTGFSTVIFGAMYLVMCVFTIKLADNRTSKRYLSIFVISIVSLALIRPEGALLGFPLLILLIYKINNSWKRVQLILGVGFPIAIYHIMRFLYFGYVFPNPFYIKSESGFQLLSVINTVMAFSRSNILLLILGTLGLLSILENSDRSKINKVFIFLLPIISHFSIYLFITQSQNINYRFQYLYILFFAILLPFGINELIRYFQSGFTLIQDIFFNHNKNIIVAAKYVMVFLVLVPMIIQPMIPLQNVGYGTDPTNDEKIIGKNLSPYEEFGYTLYVTEAGALPYYSGWNTVDAGGLNNEYIAHNGISNTYIDRYDPDVIMFYAGDGTPLPPNCSTRGWYSSSWGDITTKMYNYSVKNEYKLAAIIKRNSGHYNWYFVKDSNPHSEEITSIIRNTKRPKGYNNPPFDHIKYNRNEFPSQFSC